MADLKGGIGELHFTVQVTRKDTGITEEYELVGAIDADQLKQLQDDGIIPKQENT